MSDDAQLAPRGKNGRAPDVFRVGGWVPMRDYRNDEAVDFSIVGTGAGGGTLALSVLPPPHRTMLYNLRRPHQALGWRTPNEAYLGQSTAATALAA